MFRSVELLLGKGYRKNKKERRLPSSLAMIVKSSSFVSFDFFTNISKNSSHFTLFLRGVDLVVKTYL